MAPQTSAISSSPASRRQKSKLSHLALVDPSPIRRSSGSTPGGVISRSGCWGRSAVHSILFAWLPFCDVLCSENDDELVLNVKCHYLQAKVSKCTFELGDYAYGENGGANYIGKIIEFFKTNDDKDYFRVQWFFRAVDTVMQDAAESHDKKRLFYSDLMNDNLLDCIVSRLKIIQIQPNARVKSKSIASYDFYYAMKYSVDYSTFCTMTSKPFHSNGTVPKIKEQNGNKPCESELTLLDVYSGCGAMSTGLCLGTKLSGQVLKTKWSLDINKSACETLKLNHPETQVRNESAENFLDLLKEWDSLCKQYAVHRKGDIIKSHKSIPSGKSDKSTEGEYEVEKIVDICYGDTEDSSKRGLKCKVRWAGFGPSEDTWEPIGGLRKCQAAIKDFVQKGFTSKILPRPGDVDVICGGPPCQGISGYNRHRNYESPMDDERNHQIVVFMDLVKFLKPKYVLMENVPDILRFAKGTLGRYALSRLVQMNYQARLGIMAAGCYGLAQFRLRVFLWGANPCQHLPQFPLPTHDAILRYGAPTEFERNIVAYDEGQTHRLEKALKLADAISDLPSISNFEAGEEMKYSKPPETEFQKYVRATESEMLGFSPSAKKQAGKAVLYDHQAFPLSPDDYLRVCLIPKRKGANFRDLPGVTVDERNYARRDPSTEQTLPSGKSYVPDYAINFYEGKSMRPFGRLWWDETVPTVTCKPDPHCQAVLHPEQDRILSLRECARLQGFPDYYRFCGSPKERYRQVGNAVAVPVARALGYALGLAFQQVGDPSQPLITLPPKFSHSTAYELLHSASA
uniref:Cytosine-specific methyltransferase n=1 Tax=Kalanchoe fedtschenkoi TaxID=63787 RepID=A0A7N0UBW6_KALFE